MKGKLNMKKNLVLSSNSNFVRQLLFTIKNYENLSEADEILAQLENVGSNLSHVDLEDEHAWFSRHGLDVGLGPFVLEAIFLTQINKSEFFSREVKFNYKNFSKILNELDSKTEFTGICGVEDFFSINNYPQEIETKEVFFVPVIRAKMIKDIKSFISEKGFKPLGAFELISYLAHAHSIRKSQHEEYEKFLPKGFYSFNDDGVPIIAVRDILVRSHKQAYLKSVLLSSRSLYNLNVRGTGGGFNKLVYVICEKK